MDAERLVDNGGRMDLPSGSGGCSTMEDLTLASVNAL